MNKLKRAERTRLKEILNELMLLYDITPSEKATLDIRDLAQKVVDSWKYIRRMRWHLNFVVLLMRITVEYLSKVFRWT